MKNKNRLFDLIKDALIVLLLVSAVVLMANAVSYRPSFVLESLSTLLSGADSSDGSLSREEPDALGSAQPCYILATARDGSHYSAKYSAENRAKLFGLFSSYLGEALGSSGSPERITQGDWERALGGSGVFFDYIYPQPLSALADWLGTETSGGIGDYWARRLYLGSFQGDLCLYFISEGVFYRCNTASSFSTLADRIAELPLGMSSFAFEAGADYKSIDPYFIISEEKSQLKAVTATNPIKDGVSLPELLSLFEMNSRTSLEYTESDGSAVYVDGDNTLRIDTDGTLSFSAADGGGLSVSPESDATQDELIAACGALVGKSAGSLCGAASLGLTGISKMEASDALTISFGYYIDGVPVCLPRGYGAKLTVVSGVIIRAEICCRHYAFTGESLIPLPERLACAIASGSGGEPVLMYDDHTDGVGFCWHRS